MNAMAIRYLITIILVISMHASCSRDETGEPEDPNKPFTFTDLNAEKDTIESGESTKVKATATGYKISYHWSATAGDILGSGEEVVYTASPCQAGKNKISCTVRDGYNFSLSKEIYIVVI